MKWESVQVGQVLRVNDDELFPADLMCLYTALPDKASLLAEDWLLPLQPVFPVPLMLASVMPDAADRVDSIVVLARHTQMAEVIVCDGSF